jgi:PAS domain S-box-containing protein
MSDASRKTILLVEDEAIVAMAEAQQLEKEGYSVIQALSGEKAIDIVRSTKEPIDLILMDIDLGKGIDGAETAQKILEEHNIPVIFLSSHIEKEIVEKTEKITSYGYVVKNTGITVLDASIKMAFKLFNAHEALWQSEEYSRLIIEKIPIMIDGFDNNGHCILWNNECEKVFGWTAEELNSTTDALSLLYPDPKIRNEVLNTVSVQPDGIYREWHPKTKDGKKLLHYGQT